MEKVFIAWSGNRELAECVAAQLEKKGFRAIVGGGAHRDMYVGAQIQSQMDACAFAVILAQKKPQSTAPEFSDNLMFEWGYLISSLPASNVCAFLIDTSERELPSDLAGSWVTSLERAGRDDRELAIEVVGRIEVESQFIDKLEILSRWKEMKASIQKNLTRRRYSDYELAQFTLFSLKTAYYYDEMQEFYNAVSRLPPSTDTLEAVIQETQAIASIFIGTSNLAHSLEMEDYFELTSALSQPFEEAIAEANLARWAEILRYDALSLCNEFVSLEDDPSDREFYLSESLKWGEKTIEAISGTLADFPQDRCFAALMRGYQYRNQALARRELGQTESVIELLDLSASAREIVYSQYRRAYPDDSVLCSKLAQEYYLSLLECARYKDDQIERRRIMATVKKLLTTWRKDFDRQQALLELVRKAYDALES